jgi:hypothetical protein
MDRASALRLAAGIRAHLHNNDAEVKVLVAEGTAEPQHLRLLAQELAAFKHRMSITTMPETEAGNFLLSA